MLNEPRMSLEELSVRDGRYTVEAIHFVQEGLSYSVNKYHPDVDDTEPRHISGAQLCQSLRELAISRWGLMARSVLKHWHVRTTRDFGEIVFLLVDNKWMQKEPGDSIEDFDNVFDFDEALDGQFEIPKE